VSALGRAGSTGPRGLLLSSILFLEVFMRQQLTITLDEQGNVGINGPINNKVLCYGLLELAKDALRNYDPNKRVELATGTLPPIGG
jgi:hypothetical protein